MVLIMEEGKKESWLWGGDTARSRMTGVEQIIDKDDVLQYIEDKKDLLTKMQWYEDNWDKIKDLTSLSCETVFATEMETCKTWVGAEIGQAEEELEEIMEELTKLSKIIHQVSK